MAIDFNKAAICGIPSHCSGRPPLENEGQSLSADSACTYGKTRGKPELKPDKRTTGSGGKTAVAKQQPQRKYVSQADVPRHTIEEALRVARAIADHYGKQPTRPLAVAKAMGMKPKTGKFETLAGASVAYGFTEGGSRAESIALGDLGKRVVAPTIEGRCHCETRGATAPACDAPVSQAIRRLPSSPRGYWSKRPRGDGCKPQRNRSNLPSILDQTRAPHPRSAVEPCGGHVGRLAGRWRARGIWPVRRRSARCDKSGGSAACLCASRCRSGPVDSRRARDGDRSH